MRAADIADHEVLVVVAATCDYGWEFMAADGCYWRESEDPPDMEARGWLPDNLVTDAGREWGPNVRRWVKYTSYTHGGPPDGGIGATRWGIGQELWEYPEAVLLRKLQHLDRAGLIDGCPCGCRGDFTITEKGRAALAEVAA